MKLKKCLHGKTQHYEGLNALIWKRCPKNIYVGLTVLEIGTASAVTNFNHGMAGILKVLAKLDIIPGSNSINCCNKRDRQNIPNEQERNGFCKASAQTNMSYTKMTW